MDGAEVAAALCEIPGYLREHPDSSLAARLREILSARSGPVREADLVSVLSTRHELLDSWAAYVEDQRTADGWYVAPSSAPGRAAEWLLVRRGRTRQLAFESAIDAYAALILRVAAPGLLGVAHVPR